MKELAKSIVKYIDHMHSMGLKVSVHFSNEIMGRIPSELFDIILPYNTHTSPYCMWIKKCDNNRCIESQQELIKNGRTGVRVCHAGVREYITPFFYGRVSAGIVSVSGYREADVPDEVKGHGYELLSPDEIPVDFADTLVTPLRVMLEKLLDGCLVADNSEYNRILQYLGEYYATADLEGLCLHFHRSPSHISHLFKKNSGMTLRAYCNKLKLEEGERLVRSTNMSVTRIAMDIGFNDVSHFINLFRKKYGVSPLSYRKNIDN